MKYENLFLLKIDIDLFYNYVETIYGTICIIYKDYVIELIIKEKLEY